MSNIDINSSIPEINSSRSVHTNNSDMHISLTTSPLPPHLNSSSPIPSPNLNSQQLFQSIENDIIPPPPPPSSPPPPPLPSSFSSQSEILPQNQENHPYQHIVSSHSSNSILSSNITSSLNHPNVITHQKSLPYQYSAIGDIAKTNNSPKQQSVIQRVEALRVQDKIQINKKK